MERVSASVYRVNMILKGGFLIAAMVGVGKRSTMDIDATIKGLSINRAEIEKIIREIINIDIGDGIIFEIQNIKNIHETGEYDDFRVSLRASLFTIRVDMKVDFTTGDIIISHEIEYQYKLMFENRFIPIMVYNLYAILAEKLETIFVRGVTNTRGRDYYDAYLLLSLNKETLERDEMIHALIEKATERGSTAAIYDHAKILSDIAGSPDIAKIWDGYKRRYSYAIGIELTDILATITWVFE